MSSTPPKKEGVEQAAQSPDEEDPAPMDREAQETQAQGLGYEFEVKEQDRWLPIANGASISLSPSYPLICAPFRSCCKLTDRSHLASLDARISVNRAEEPFRCRITLAVAAALCTCKTAALQPSCPLHPPTPPRRRHTRRPTPAPAPAMSPMLTFVILLQSPAS